MIQDRVMRSGVAVVLGLALALSGMGAWCADAAHVERLPVPPASDLAKARDLVRAAYEPDYAAVNQSGEPAPLVAKLRAAADSAVGPLEKYAFLMEAQALATEHEDAVMTLAIVDRRGEIFEIDGLAERSQALARLAGPKTVADLGIMEQAMETALKAAAVERFEIATQAATLALNVAKAVDREQKASARRQAQRKQAPGEVVPTPNGAGLIKSAFDLQKRIGRQREMFKACEEAKAVLVRKPEDEAANAAVGTYLCFVADDWEAGLPYLNRSRLPLVSGLARDELAIDVGDQDTKAVFDLAGKWWDAADDKRLADDEKNSIRKHAARLYGGIVTTLNNPLERRVAESRGAPQLDGDTKDSPTIVNSVGIKLKLIPAGSFMMGSEDGDDDEKPVHKATITKPFYLGVTEVTNAQWRRVMGGDPPSQWKDDGLPVEQVSWPSVVEFCRRLSNLPEERSALRTYRLPTEAEWEYACRAGRTSRWANSNDENRLGDVAWFLSNSGRQTHAVGQKQPNPWGLHDMHGNVWEWCSDWYGPYPAGVAVNPAGPDQGLVRVGRGGAWDSTTGHCRSAKRGRYDPSGRTAALGFRLALSLYHDTVFLSDLPGRDPVVGMGEFGTNGEAGFFGKKIIVNQTLAEKGLSTHCKDGVPVGVTYDVPSMARRFVAAVSVLDDVATQPGGRKNCGSPIIFRLRGQNGVVLWTSPKPVEKVGDIFFCDVPVVGQKTLRLEASCAGSDDWCSAVWLNPYFVVSDQPVADALSSWRPATNP